MFLTEQIWGMLCWLLVMRYEHLVVANSTAVRSLGRVTIIFHLKFTNSVTNCNISAAFKQYQYVSGCTKKNATRYNQCQ
jgi:hypothetical protein